MPLGFQILPVRYVPRSTTKIMTTIYEILRDLNAGIRSIYANERISCKRYMDLYTKVYNLNYNNACRSEIRRGRILNIVYSHQMVVAERNRRLYDNIKATVTEHVRCLRERGREKHDEELLRYFCSEWKCFRFQTNVIKQIFCHLYRHYLHHKIMEDNSKCFKIEHLAVLIWREVFVDDMTDLVLRAILKLIEKDRDGEIIDRRLISGISECYVEIQDDLEVCSDVPIGEADNIRLDIYMKRFENDFLEESELYYARKCSEFLKVNTSILDYMNKVDCLLNEEKLRCERYLRSSTVQKLYKILGKKLISPQLHLFHEEISDLLQKKKVDDLNRMYRLCSLVNSLDVLSRVFQDFVRDKGLAAIAAVADQSVVDPNLLVQSAVAVLNCYEEMVKTCFYYDSKFMAALGRATTVFLNNNAVTIKSKNNQCPEYLARYVDSLLRKSSKMSDSEQLELLLGDVAKVLLYVEDRDVFQKFYTRMFYKRLITDSFVNEDAESFMIRMLNDVFEFSFTKNLQQIFTANCLSKELTKEFRNSCKNQKEIDLGFDFSVKVLAEGGSPIRAMANIRLPLTMNNAMDAFTVYYFDKYQGRQLIWPHSQSRGELTSSGFAKKYSFLAWTPQMAVLLLFNERTEYTMDILKENLGMEKEQLVYVLGTLLKNDIVVSEQITSEEVCTATSGDTIFKLNMKFTSTRIKVDLSKTVMRVEQKKEAEVVHNSVDNDRKMAIQAAIVRIMKTRKTSTHTTLTGEVLSQLSTRFKPQISTIKQCIDVLIEKEYLKRKEDEKDTYQYLA